MEERTKQIAIVAGLIIVLAVLFVRPQSGEGGWNFSGLFNWFGGGGGNGGDNGDPSGPGGGNQGSSPPSVVLQLSSSDMPRGSTLGGIIHSNRANQEVVFYAHLKKDGAWQEVFRGITNDQGQYYSATKVNTPGVFEAYASMGGVDSNVVTFWVRGIYVVMDDAIPINTPFEVDLYTSYPGETFQIQFSDDNFGVHTWLLWQDKVNANSGHITVKVPTGLPSGMTLQFRAMRVATGEYSENVVWVTFS